MRKLFAKDIPWVRVTLGILLIGAVALIGWFAIFRWDIGEKPKEIGAAIKEDVPKLKASLRKASEERDKEKAEKEAAEKKLAEEEVLRKQAEEKLAALKPPAKRKPPAQSAPTKNLPPLMPFSRVASASKEETLTRLVTGADLIISKEKLIERLKEIVGRHKGFGTGAEGEFADAQLMEILRRDGIVVCVPFRKTEVAMDGLVRAEKARGVEKIVSFPRDSYPNECFLGIRIGDRIYRLLSLLCFNTANDHTGVPRGKSAEASPPARAADDWTPIGPRVVVAPPAEEIVVVRRPRVIVEEIAPPVQYVQVPQYVAAPMYAAPMMYAVPAHGYGGGGSFALNIASSRVNINRNFAQPAPVAPAPNRSIAVNTRPVGSAVGTTPRGIVVHTR